MLHVNDLLIEEHLCGENKSKTVMLDSITPIGAIEKQGDMRVALSLDGIAFEEITGGCAQGETALFVKLETGSEGALKVFVGEGYIAIPAPRWSDAFKRYDDWAGGDGIYSFNLDDGNDAYGHAAARTMFLFSDTIVSKVDRETLRRIEPVYMPNNTFAIVTGSSPEAPGAFEFFVKKDEDGKPMSGIRPNRDCFDFEGKGEDLSKAYLWNQDGVVLNGKFYLVLHLITEDRTREEGFQFRVLGECIAEAEIVDGIPDISNAKQYATGLQYVDERVTIRYGAGIMPYTKEAGYPDGDGYVYVYGRTNPPMGVVSLCIARVRPEHFTDWTQWRFFDGAGFTDDITKSAPIVGHVSSELSVTPIVTGRNRGKFLAVFKYDDLRSDYVACAVGDSPAGPFGEPRKVFYSGADKLSPTVYTYNAKAHPHLSIPERLLVSYNVNCRTWWEHIENGHMYRPRFMELIDTTA